MGQSDNSFIYSLNTLVTNVYESGGKTAAVFKETIFYPGGGGQPCDTGKVFSGTFEADVISVSKHNDIILHTLDVTKGQIKAGDNVLLEINRQRRENLVRMHTGEHMLYKCLENLTKDLSLVKIDLAESESSLFVACENLDWDILFKAEANVNRLIKEDKKINVLDLTKEEAAELKELRIKLDRIKTPTIRVINIDGFDYSACTGTHAGSTGFAGNLFITKFALNHGNYEIRYKTNVSDFSEYLNPIRKAASVLGTDIAGVPNLIEKTIAERDSFKENYRKALEKIPVEFSADKRGDAIFKSAVVEKFERKKIIDTINSELKENTIVLVVNMENDKANTFLSCSADLQIDIPEKLKIALDKFGGKGGGKGLFAQGSVDAKYSDAIIAVIKKIIFS